MRLVTFAENMAPHSAGDTRLVPDDVAKRLQADGLLSASVPYPPDERQAVAGSRISGQLKRKAR